MNILISIDYLGIGGAQTFAIRLAQALSKKHHVYIFNHEYYKEKTHESPFINQLNSDIKVIHFPHFPHPLYFLAWLAFKIDYWILFRLQSKFKLSQIIKIWYFKNRIFFEKIDIINSHLFHSDLIAGKALANSRIPIVVTDHGDYRNFVDYGISNWQEISTIVNKVDAIIYPCKYNADHLSKKIENITTIQKIIYYGLDTEYKTSYPESARQKLGISQDALVFGMVARGIPEKGWNEAIQAFDFIKKSLKEREIHLILVGGSDYLSSLQKYWEPKLINTIHFVGSSSNPSYWVETFNVALLPTYLIGESLPNSIIEYLALGKPVIATEVGGIPEMMNHDGQIPGFLISLSNNGKADVSMMADAMLKYVNEHDLIERHSCLAKQAFEKFKMETCIKAYEHLFENILNQVSSGYNDNI